MDAASTLSNVRETLYIQLRAADPGAPTAFCIARPDAVASFAVNVAPLETVLLQAGNRRLVVFAPSTDVRLTTLKVAARQPSKALQAAPYALEDQLADDVETLHFAVGRYRLDQWPVAVVAQARMSEWLDLFATYGLRPDSLVPDVLALPAPDAEHYSLLLDGQQVLVRTTVDGGFVCERTDLELCLQIADPDKRKTLRALVPRGEDIDLSVLGRPVEPLHGFSAPLEALLQNYHPEDAINLLQGQYSQQQDWIRLWQPWRMVAALLVVAIVLSGAIHGVQAWRLQSALSAQDAANVQRYQQLFPNETRIVDLSAQLEQQAGRLKNAGGQNLLPLLETLARAMQSVPGLKLQTLQYREGALFVGLTGANLELLEQLKSWFTEPRSAALEVQSANSGTDGVQIRIRLSPA